MGTLIIILITLAIFSTVYILTRSLAFSSIAMVATFYIHPSGNLARWLIGYFYNGPYPNMYGYLILIMFVIFWLILPKNERKDKKFIIMTLSCIFGLLVVYPPFAILPVLFILTELIIKKFSHRNSDKKGPEIKQPPENGKNFIKTHFPQWNAIFIPAISLDILFLSQIVFRSVSCTVASSFSGEMMITRIASSTDTSSPRNLITIFLMSSSAEISSFSL